MSSKFSSDEESGKEYDYDPPVGAFPVIEPTSIPHAIPSADIAVNDEILADSREPATDEIDSLATEVLYPVHGEEKNSGTRIAYTLVGEENIQHERIFVDERNEIERDVASDSISGVTNNASTDAMLHEETATSISQTAQNPVEYIGSPLESSEKSSATNEISAADRLTYETVREFMDAHTTALSQQSSQNIVDHLSEAETTAFASSSSPSFSEAETTTLAPSTSTEYETPTTVLSSSPKIQAEMEAVTTAIAAASPDQIGQRVPDKNISGQDTELHNPSSRDLAVASYFDEQDLRDPQEIPVNQHQVAPIATQDPSTRDLVVASYFDEDIMPVAAGGVAAEDNLVEEGLPLEDDDYPYLITAEIMANLRSKAQRYRPILLEVNNLLSEQALPGHLSPETAKLMHSAAAERTALQMIIPEEIAEDVIPSQPFSAGMSQVPVGGPVMRTWVAVASTFALFLAIFVVLINVILCMINFVDGTILGISMGGDPRSWSSNFGAAHMTLFPPSPLAPGDAVLVIFAYPLVMCITLVVARYLVLTFGARIIFILSAFAFCVIGYIISQVTSLTGAGYLLGTWGAAGSFMLVSAIYLLNRLHTTVRFNHYVRSGGILAFLLLFPLTGVVFWVVNMNYLVSTLLTVISFLIIFNTGSSHYRDMPVAEGRDIVGTILLIIFSGILGWTFIEGEYWQLVETTNIWVYFLALVIFIGFLIYEYISPQSFLSFHGRRGKRDTFVMLLDYLITAAGSVLWNFVVFMVGFYITSWNHLNLHNVALKVLPFLGGIIVGYLLMMLVGRRIPAALQRAIGFVVIALAIAWFIRITQYSHESKGIFLSEIILFAGAVFILGDFIHWKEADQSPTDSLSGSQPSCLGIFLMQFFGFIIGMIIPALVLIQKRSEILFASSQNSVSTMPLTMLLGGKKISGEVLNVYASGDAIHDSLYRTLGIAGIGLVLAIISLGVTKKFASTRIPVDAINELV